MRGRQAVPVETRASLTIQHKKYHKLKSFGVAKHIDFVA